MIQSIVQDILIAVAILAVVAAGFIYAPDPLGETITNQLLIMRR